jgi:serine/threonine protein kinase
MALSAGTRLGPYEIIATVGAGGMGEVYRAHDTRLNRDIALKILPQSVAADPDRLARFQREAEVLAALNHPNIAHVHGLEESNGTRARVMEFVEGETLAARIARGPVSLDEALPIARQIANVLESMHERGIVHRDLKPANIMVMPDGQVKVLDFGLANALAPAGAGVPGSLRVEILAGIRTFPARAAEMLPKCNHTCNVRDSTDTAGSDALRKSGRFPPAGTRRRTNGVFPKGMEFDHDGFRPSEDDHDAPADHRFRVLGPPCPCAALRGVRQSFRDGRVG